MAGDGSRRLFIFALIVAHMGFLWDEARFRITGSDVMTVNGGNALLVVEPDGVDVWRGVTRAASGRGGATDWELLQVRSNSYPNLEFWLGGVRGGSPFE